MTFNTPILLIASPYAETLCQLIDAIRAISPTQLFVACYGSNSDRLQKVEKAAVTHELIERVIDWPCTINFSYFESQHGFSKGTISSINWFFSHVEEGIILENDCIPEIAFFDYCKWALNVYRGEKRVMHINGSNFSASSSLYAHEVSFVSLPQVWGWATWSDRWNFFEDNPFYSSRQSRYRRWSLSPIARLNKLRHLHALKKGLDAWDYQWQITVLNRRGLAVCPRNNLILKAGVDSDVIHSINSSSCDLFKTGGFVMPIKLPPIKNNVPLTKFFEKQMHLTLQPGLIVWLCASLLTKFSRLLKYVLISIVFGKYIPVVVASTGRAGSTMLVNSIAASFVQARYSLLSPYLIKMLTKISSSYFDRLEDIGLLRRAPVIKTHDLYRSDLKKDLKYIYVYGDPLDSAVSALQQGKLRGSVWLDEHIYHLCGQGTPDQVLVKDILNYEEQLSSWETSPAMFVHYSEIWKKKDELSVYLGFPLHLPPQRIRSSKESINSVSVNHILFDRLKIIEQRFRKNVSAHSIHLDANCMKYFP